MSPLEQLTNEEVERRREGAFLEFDAVSDQLLKKHVTFKHVHELRKEYEQILRKLLNSPVAIIGKNELSFKDEIDNLHYLADALGVTDANFARFNAVVTQNMDALTQGNELVRFREPIKLNGKELNMYAFLMRPCGSDLATVVALAEGDLSTSISQDFSKFCMMMDSRLAMYLKIAKLESELFVARKGGDIGTYTASVQEAETINAEEIPLDQRLTKNGRHLVTYAKTPKNIKKNAANLVRLLKGDILTKTKAELYLFGNHIPADRRVIEETFTSIGNETYNYIQRLKEAFTPGKVAYVYNPVTGEYDNIAEDVNRTGGPVTRIGRTIRTLIGEPEGPSLGYIGRLLSLGLGAVDKKYGTIDFNEITEAVTKATIPTKDGRHIAFSQIFPEQHMTYVLLKALNDQETSEQQWGHQQAAIPEGYVTEKLVGLVSDVSDTIEVLVHLGMAANAPESGKPETGQLPIPQNILFAQAAGYGGIPRQIMTLRSDNQEILRGVDTTNMADRFIFGKLPDYQGDPLHKGYRHALSTHRKI